jgi:branched-chain amino acid transport system substrate-binding protein
MRKRWSRIFALSMGIPLLLTMLAACGAGTTGSGGSATVTPSGPIIIKIGTDYPTTAKDASAGLPTQNGASLAVTQANQEKLVPGVTFVLDPKDDVGPSGTHDASVGQKNMLDLIGDAQVAAVGGTLNSAVAQAEMPEANQASMPMISPANTNDCLTQTQPAFECGGKNDKLPTYRPTNIVTYFRIATRDQFQGAALADFAFKTKGYKSAYIIDDTETYGVGIATSVQAEWAKLGGKLLGRSSEAPTTTSYVNLLTQIASLKPDVIFFGGNDSTGGTLIRQQMLQIPALKQTPMVAGDGTQTSSFATTIGAYKSDGSNGGPVFTSVASVHLTGSAANKFISDYSAAYGASNIGAYSAGSYDCTMVIIQAAKEVLASGVKPAANSGDAAQGTVFRKAMVKAIQNISYNGVTGHISFDANGDTTSRIISIYTIANPPTTGDGWSFIEQLTL